MIDQRDIKIQPQILNALFGIIEFHQKLIEFIMSSFLYRCSIVNTSRSSFDKSYVVFKAVMSAAAVMITLILDRSFRTVSAVSTGSNASGFITCSPLYSR